MFMFGAQRRLYQWQSKQYLTTNTSTTYEPKEISNLAVNF